MKQGDILGGYRVVTQPTNAGGGKCLWAFAEKDGAEFFIKQFLAPKRPRPDGGGSARSRQNRLRLCEEFETRHRSIMDRLTPEMPGGGHLVLAVDFFAEGTTYYKVTTRIDTSTLEKPQLLEPRHKAVLLKTLAVSLNLLHGISIVHGDLKPANVLVQQHGGNAFHVAKLIDFDDSYLSGSPPSADDIAGDSVYGAPEWRRYVQREESVQPRQLTTAVDIFALGLMTHFYLTGALPQYDDRFGSPADAVNARGELRLDTRLTDPMHNLLRAMLSRAPSSRPRASTVLSALKDSRVCALEHRRPGTGAAAPPAGSGTGTAKADADTTTGGRRTVAQGVPPRTSRLRGRMAPSSSRDREPARAEPPADDVPEAASVDDGGPRVSRVRINLGTRGRTAPEAAPTNLVPPSNDEEKPTS